MKSASVDCRDDEHKHFHIFKKERILIKLANNASFLLYTACFTIILSLYLLYPQRNIMFTPTSLQQEENRTNTSIQLQKGSKECDLSKGQWIPDPRGPLYTNSSCKTIPLQRNCFMHGRKDRHFLYLRWKPDQCELPPFNPQTFLAIVRGKTMAFIGDSLARNQMESLLCLLSTVETPKSTYKDASDRFTTWKFPKHNFTLMAIWSQFLVAATDRLINGSATGSFDIHLDRIDTSWSEKLTSVDYAIFSDAHWFFRQHNLYEGGDLIGCIYCQEPNVTDFGPNWAIRRAFQAAFGEINNCTNCRKIFALLRTFSPSQFENGEWNNGGACNRTRPVGRDEVKRGGPDWEYRKIQVEEIENARNAGEESGNIFEVLDVTEMMIMRPDGHPGVYWGNNWMKGYSDCIHWCLPGPIDAWNELLLESIKRRVL